MRLEIEVELLGESKIPYLSLSGEVDQGTVSQLKNKGEKLIEEGATFLVCDMSALTYVDSYGYGTLISLHKKTQQNGGKLLLVGIPSRIRRIFEITRLGDIFDVFDTREDALASLGS